MLVYGHIAGWKNKAVNIVGGLVAVGGIAALVIGVAADVMLPAFAGFAFLFFGLMLLVIRRDGLEVVRLVPDEFYKPLGVFDATVRNVAPHVVEVETDSGAILFADADRVPEVACFRGSRVGVDASVVVSPAGQGGVRADGVGGFVDARKCECTAGYGADVAMGDEPRGKWNGKARFYAVTAVRAAD